MGGGPVGGDSEDLIGGAGRWRCCKWGAVVGVGRAAIVGDGVTCRGSGDGEAAIVGAVDGVGRAAIVGEGLVSLSTGAPDDPHNS